MFQSPARHPPRTVGWRLPLLLAAISLAVLLAERATAAHAVSMVQWLKQPDVIDVTLTQPDQQITFSEVLVNQGDPAGLGAFTFTVIFDSQYWQPPQVDLTPAYDLFDGHGRVLQCWDVPAGPDRVRTACASTGVYGSGPVWTGAQVLAVVSMRLQPTVANGLLASGGAITAVVSDTAQVTNTCGQALNDGTIMPIPGQPECQGNPLPGIDASGVVINPGSTTITVRVPMPPTHTATRTNTSVPTNTETRTPTRTSTPRAMSTAPLASTTRTPSRTVTPNGTTTPGGTRTTVAVTGTVAASSTAMPGLGACPHAPNFWIENASRLPETLNIGTATYTRDDVLSLLAAPDSAPVELRLGRELAAAKANIATNADPVGAALVTRGDEVATAAMQGRLPEATAVAEWQRIGITWLTAELTSYNDGCRDRNVVAGIARTPGASSTLRPDSLPATGVAGLSARDLSRVLIVLLSLVIAVLLILLLRTKDEQKGA